MSDDLTVLGQDGVRRNYDEHYDTMAGIEQDPTGAWQAIQRQHGRIEELEAKLAEARIVIAAGKEMYETAMLTGGGSHVAWANHVKARNVFAAKLAELTGGNDV